MGDFRGFDTSAPLYASVEQAVHEALRDRAKPAHDPNAQRGGGDHELAMVARGYVLRAVDAIEVHARSAFLAYVETGSVRKVAKLARTRESVIAARIDAARAELQAVLAERGLVPR